MADLSLVPKRVSGAIIGLGLFEYLRQESTGAAMSDGLQFRTQVLPTDLR